MTDQELAALKEKLLTMASKAEAAVNNAIKALLDRDDDLARSVKEEDNALDQLEIEVDEVAIGLHVPGNDPAATMQAMEALAPR